MSKNKSQKRHMGCFTRLLVVFVVVFVLFAAGFAAVKGMKVKIQPSDIADEVAAVEELPDEWINIMLLGADAGAGARTDTMIIASVNGYSGELKLTSLMRDMYVPIDGYGSNKLNTAHHFGGVELALKTINKNFNMNISRYVKVDFASFAKLVELIGGIDVPVTQTEMEYMNSLMQDMRVLYPEIELEKSDLTEYGDSVHLNGMQALAYVRIRKLDNDYNRTSRQRTMIKAIVSKLISVQTLTSLDELYDMAMEEIETNLEKEDILKLAAKALSAGLNMTEFRLPVADTYHSENVSGVGSCLVADMEENTKQLHEFIYGAED